MVARTPPQTPRFTPVFTPIERPRIAIAGDGSLAAIAEPARVVVVELPSCGGLAEIGTDPEAAATEVAWVGAPPRLIVLSRYASHSTVHLLDPHGPRSIAELRLETPMRLFASVGPHALTAGSQGAAILTASDTHLMPYQFPARAAPLAAGAAAGLFLVALPGAIEEWDPQTRMPKRRLRLPRPAVITALGGSERVVWMTTQQEPARLDVISLVNRGQPKVHDLPEPIAHATSHPRSDLVLCLGAQSHRLYVVDLDGKKRLRVLGFEGLDRVEGAGLVVGRAIAALGAQAKRPLAILPLDDAGGTAERPSTAPADAAVADDEADAPHVSSLSEPDGFAPEPLLVTARGTAAAAPGAPRAPVRASAVDAALRSAGTATSPLGFTPPAGPPSPSRQAAVGAPSPAAAPRPGGDAAARWRDDVVAWARAIVAGIEREPPAASLVDALIERFELAVSLRRTLILLYGAHLCGEPGVAPIDVSRVDDRSWDEALGRGALAAARLAVYERSRVRLAPALLRALDELPAATGTLVGTTGPISLLAPWAIVAAPGEALEAVAARLAPQIECAILAAHAATAPAELFLEARARGAVPLLRAAAAPETVAILAVDDEDEAERLGLPLL